MYLYCNERFFIRKSINKRLPDTMNQRQQVIYKNNIALRRILKQKKINSALTVIIIETVSKPKLIFKPIIIKLWMTNIARLFFTQTDKSESFHLLTSLKSTTSS